MTDFQRELLNILNNTASTSTTKQKKSANHIYLKQGCAEHRKLLSEQKLGKHWKLVDNKRVWY